MKRITKPSITGDGSLDATGADVYVLGGGPVGAAVARRLREDGHAVALIDESHEPSDVPARRADPTDVTALADTGLEAASTVVVATPADSRNFLVAQLVRTRFDVDRVLVVANEPDRVDPLADADLDPVCAATNLANAVVDHL